MTRPTQPQAVDTESDAWLWQWRNFEGFEPDVDLFELRGLWHWTCMGCGNQAWAHNRELAEAEFLSHVRTVHQVEHEHELEWLRTERRWQERSSYERAGWPALRVLRADELDEPDSYQHAEQLAHEYAARPRGGQ